MSRSLKGPSAQEPKCSLRNPKSSLKNHNVFWRAPKFHRTLEGSSTVAIKGFLKEPAGATYLFTINCLAMFYRAPHCDLNNPKVPQRTVRGSSTVAIEAFLKEPVGGRKPFSLWNLFRPSAHLFRQSAEHCSCDIQLHCFQFHCLAEAMCRGP